MTAQYLTMVCAVSIAGLFNRLATMEKRDVLTVLKTAWREMIIWGTTVSYMIFTVSRSSTVAVGVLVIFLLVVIGATAFVKNRNRKHKQESADTGTKKRGTVCVMFVSVVLSAVILFPAAFTLQRIIPPLNGEQEVLPEVEEVSSNPFYEDYLRTAPFILGKTQPDNAGYLRVRRFAYLFNNRILGGPDVFEWFYFDPENHDENGFLKYWFKGEDLPEWYLILMEEQLREIAAESLQETGASATIESSVLGANDAAVSETASVLSESADSAADRKNISEEPQESLPVAPTETADISNGRFEIYRSYLENLNMTGHPKMTNENTISSHAHNIYLQVAFDCGIPVGILFFTWIGFTIIGALLGYVRFAGTADRKERAQAASCIMMLSVAVGFAVVGMFDWAFHLANPSTVILMTGIAPLVVCSGKKR